MPSDPALPESSSQKERYRSDVAERFQLRLPNGMRDNLKAVAETAHRSMNSEIVARLTASFEERPASEPQSADDSGEVSDADLAALNTIGERALTGERFSLVAKPACPMGVEPSAGLDIDRLDRLTAIVDRTRLALGQAAARQLWPMLGLPTLRTSSRQTRSSDDGPDLFSGFGAADTATDLRTSPTIKPFEAKLPREYVSAFMGECCAIDPKGEVSAKAFREAYVAWASSNGAPLILQSVLGKFAVSLGVRPRKTGGTTVYIGCRLHDEVRRSAAGA